MQVWSLALLSGSGIAVSYGVDCRCGLDPELLLQLLQYRQAAAALIRPLAWELLCAADEALKKKQKQKQKQNILLKYSEFTMLY